MSQNNQTNAATLSGQSITKSPHVQGAYQWTYSRGNRKCVLTRISAKRWAYARGWAGDIAIGKLHGGESPTKRLAVAHIKGWLMDARV